MATFLQRPERDEGVSPTDIWKNIKSFLDRGKMNTKVLRQESALSVP